MSEYFTDVNHLRMVAARDQIRDTLQPVAEQISRDVASFEGFALFQHDTYHPDSAGAIVQINTSGNDFPGRFSFQRKHISDRRVDLSVSTLGETFTTGKYALQESRMNPEQHLVAGLHLPEQVGKRAASVFQLAFTRQIGSPSAGELEQIRSYWQAVAGQCEPQLEVLHREAQHFPNDSVSDALKLDVPTTPNAFVINWDTSHSREQARQNYGKLRYELTVRGQQFLDIVERHGGTYMRPTGDGQSFALEIPAHRYDRLSDDSIAAFADAALFPLLDDLRASAENGDITTPVRFAIELGRVEATTFDLSSPALFELASVSDELPHEHTSVGFGKRAIQVLQLSQHHP